jgi:hypothetical protein
MYEALDTRSHAIYQGRTVADLRQEVELNLQIPESELPPYYNRWSDSRRITYLIQAGYITPYSGPEWFMALKPPNAPGEPPVASERPRHTSKHIQIIRYNGTVSEDAEVHLTFWQERNQLRIVFRDEEQIYAEVFINEESMRRLWVLLGKMCSFEADALYHALLHLPPAQLYTPEIAPQRIPRPSSSEDFDILKAIDELDLDLDSQTNPDQEDDSASPDTDTLI